MPTFAIRTHRLTIERLKGVRELDEISFEDKTLTGIFGPNGVGKSTVLHALASAYRSPLGQASSYLQFFPPLAGDVWNGTRFIIDHTFKAGQVEARGEIEYRKGTATKEWTPELLARPLRNISYVGVKTCLPDIEAYENHDLTNVISKPLVSDIDTRVREAAGRILNYRYAGMASIAIPGEPDRTYTSLTRQDLNGLEYPSVTMGAGEQRLFKLLYAVERMPDHGLILVDELDLLLHGDALKRLIVHLSERCRSKRLQLVFTSHREELLGLNHHINIRHLCALPEGHRCFSNTDPDSLHRLTGKRIRPLEVFVEDDVAEAVAGHVASELAMIRHVDLIRFGAASNCFTMVAGLLMRGENCENSLFLLDGDVFLDQKEREEQINRACSGSDSEARGRRAIAAKHIRDLVLPHGIKPERYLHRLVCALPATDLKASEIEIQRVAQETIHPTDSHGFIDDLASTLGDNRDVQLARVIPLAAKHPEWAAYTQPLREWLIQRKISLNLP